MKILEQRFDSARDSFSFMTCAEQGEFIKHQFQVAGASACLGVQNSMKKKLNTSQKMKKLLKQSKTIKKKLKSRVLQPPQILTEVEDGIKADPGGNQNTRVQWEPQLKE